ncbi:MAG: RNA deprotection pyrophosphohydrolase [Bacillus sp. (in: firmicutes)]
MREKYRDVQGNTVEFTDKPNSFQQPATHVLVLVHSSEGWIMTRHRVRGLEFPGGKQELGETLEETAIREVYEETGAVIDQPIYIGQYKVGEGDGVFIKNVYFAKAADRQMKDSYMETDGPCLLPNLPACFLDEEFSYIMQDKTVPICLSLIRKRKLIETS